MAFTLEDGNGVTDANAYITEAVFISHHTDRGRDTSFYSTTDIEAAIVKATDYIDQRFGKRFRGVRVSHDQGLEWPRLGAFDNNGFLLDGLDQVPRLLQRACAEYALIVLRLVANELLPLPAPPFATIDEDTGEVTGGTSGQIIRDRSKVGPIETEQWYDPMRPRSGSGGGGIAVDIKSPLVDDLNIPDYPRADIWLEQLLRPSMNVTLGRGD